MSDLISRKALIEKAYEEAKHMAEPYEDFGVLVEWLAEKTPSAQPNSFTVIDKKTGHAPDYEKLGIEYKLCYCDMEGFAIGEDGELYLLDECGKWEWPDQDRFEVIWDE